MPARNTRRRRYPDAALVYVDGDADLATPQTTSSGVLDAMGIAHLLRLADTPLAQLDGRQPMLSPGRTVLAGYDETAGAAWPRQARSQGALSPILA